MNSLKTHIESDTSRYVEVHGINIHFNDAGQGEIVIMLHGSGPGASGWSNFNRNIDALAATHRVLCVDMPGWGKSDPRETGINFFEWFADKIIAVMDALDIEKASVIGNSLGGGVAFKMALEHPDRIDRLVLMGSPVGFAMFGDRFPPGIQDILFFYEGEGPTLEKLQSFASKFVYDPSKMTDELLNQRLEASKKFIDNPPMKFGPGDAMEPLWQHPALTTLPHDVLLIWGRDDKVVPLDRGLSTFSQIPKARLYVIPQCGHWAQWEQAEEFNRVVSGFLTGE